MAKSWWFFDRLNALPKEAPPEFRGGFSSFDGVLYDVGLVNIDRPVLIFVFFDGGLYVGTEKVGKALTFLFQYELDLFLLCVGEIKIDGGGEFLAVRHNGNEKEDISTENIARKEKINSNCRNLRILPSSSNARRPFLKNPPSILRRGIPKFFANYALIMRSYSA